MGRPRGADVGTAFNMDGSYKYILKK